MKKMVRITPSPEPQGRVGLALWAGFDPVGERAPVLVPADRPVVFAHVPAARAAPVRAD